MAKKYEIMKEKRKRQQEPISFAKQLDRAIERYKRPTPVKLAEVMTYRREPHNLSNIG